MKYLNELVDIPFQAFKAVDVVTYHYVAQPSAVAPYAVWQEETDDSFNSDNAKSERSLNGILEYFTLEELDPGVDKLEEAMQKMGATWELTATQFENETNLIHYSWDWRVC